ncbi:MAG: general secretion pathway protein GspB [Gammaproteobacteria bacterium]|nr:hypothetical protein [Gammaproteobacteria bacterium]
MSFILDALRKSERERRQEIPPSIARIPDAVPSRATPTWAIATIAVLGACVLALGGAWIYTVVTEPAGTTAPGADTARVADVGRTVGTTRVEPVSLPPEPPAPTASTGSAPRNGERTSAETATSEPRNVARGPSLAELAQRAEPETRIPAAGAPARSLRDAAMVGSSSAPRPEARDTREGLPPPDPSPASYASLAPSLGLPKLEIEILAYADDPAQRFVFIGGRRYREGDTLPGGMRVISINPRGAVLLANGRQLQLDQH